MTSPLLSVLIASYQAEKTIRRAVESALSQPDTEVIIAPDDNSEGYRDLAIEFQGRVKVLAPTWRNGPGRSRNRAFDASAGAWVTMLDCDDYFSPGALSEALSLAQQSTRQVAFLRTAYVHDGTGLICRELPGAPTLSFDAFMEFHGSIHALYPRSKWRPYTVYPISQDVLFDAALLLAHDGRAPLTTATHVKTIHPRSLTASTDQTVFNQEYSLILERESDQGIQQLFREKLRMGRHYQQFLASGPPLSFHEFMKRGVRIRSAMPL